MSDIEFLDCDCAQNIAENFRRVLGQVGSVLPTVTGTDNGKVLTVSDGKWAAVAPTGHLPTVTADDNGKVLTADGGEWVAKELPAEVTPDGGE